MSTKKNRKMIEHVMIDTILFLFRFHYEVVASLDWGPASQIDVPIIDTPIPSFQVSTLLITPNTSSKPPRV